MSDKPILFSGAMVRALLDGSKTQTRRLIKDRGRMPEFCAGRYDDKGDPSNWGWENHDRGDWVTLDEYRRFKFVPIAVGDRLWVRENVRAVEHESGEDAVEYIADGVCRTIDNNSEAADRWGEMYYYGKTPPSHDARQGAQVPSIHMPRWASRLTLTVTDVRVQRLQDLDRGDAMAEGCPFPNMAKGPSPKDWFAELWDSLNADRAAWDANPWVVAYTFTTDKRNIGEATT